MMNNPEVIVYIWLILAVCLAILPAFFAACGLAFDIARKAASLVLNSSAAKEVLEQSEEEAAA